jgi:DNA-binding response OmpR family regulator
MTSPKPSTTERLRIANRRIRELEAENLDLRAQVSCKDAFTPNRDILPDPLKTATFQVQALYHILAKAYPKALSKEAIEEALPKKDHAHERYFKIVDVTICHLRKAIGHDAIETIWGKGVRLRQIHTGKA